MTQTYALEHPWTGEVMPVDSLPMAPARAGTMVPFNWVPILDVPAKHRRFVVRHVNRLAPKLGIGRVMVVFYDATPSGTPVREVDFWHHFALDPGGDFVLGGMASKAEEPLRVPFVALLVGLRGRALAETIAHELRHLAQPESWSRAEKETDAERYAAEYVARAA